MKSLQTFTDACARECCVPHPPQPGQLWQAHRAQRHFLRIQELTVGDTGNGYVGIGIFVNGNGFSHTILRTIMGKDEDVVDKLTEKADEQLQSFFPGV